jgi:EmrB/QacA subfamily drug resistance transporter
MTSIGSAGSSQTIRYGTPVARWVLVATVLGSGISFIDSTVVNVALPAIARDLHAGISGLQWTVDGYLLTLGALILMGGSLGDVYGRRRIFVVGLGIFTLASALCALAPSIEVLILARTVQGCGGALLVPGSLAMLTATFESQDRARAIGAWSGLSGVTTAVGPFLGGYLIDAGSWRLVFFINLPIAAVAAIITLRHVPESRDTGARRPDVAGALLAAAGLGGLIYGLIEAVPVAVVVGVALLGLFFFAEARTREPMLPLELFKSRLFSGANATTLAVYFALGGAMFFLVLQLQRNLGYSALEAVTILMLFLSPRTGALSQRTGPRLPMTIGPIVVACGLALMARLHGGSHYVFDVLPAALVFGAGLSVTVAPLTATVLGAVETRHAGIASGINNAVARIAGLLAIAVLPLLAGVARGSSVTDATFSAGFARAMVASALLSAVGGAVAFATIRGAELELADDVSRAYQPRGVGHPACVHDARDHAA